MSARLPTACASSAMPISNIPSHKRFISISGVCLSHLNRCAWRKGVKICANIARNTNAGRLYSDALSRWPRRDNARHTAFVRCFYTGKTIMGFGQTGKSRYWNELHKVVRCYLFVAVLTATTCLLIAGSAVLANPAPAPAPPPAGSDIPADFKIATEADDYVKRDVMI